MDVQNISAVVAGTNALPGLVDSIGTSVSNVAERVQNAVEMMTGRLLSRVEG